MAALLIVFSLSGARSSAAAVGTQGFPVTTAQENERAVAVDGEIAVWMAGGATIRGKNLVTDQALTFPAGAGLQTNPSVSGRTVVWQETTSNGDSDTDSDIYGYNIVTREKFPVAVRPDDDQTKPIVDGNIVVWQDNRSGNSDIYAHNLDTGESTVVSDDPAGEYAPAVSGTTVVWEERDARDSDVVVKDLATGALERIADEPALTIPKIWQDSPAIGGDKVVWQEDGARTSNIDIEGYDLKRKVGFEVTGASGDQLAPAVDGRVVVWTDAADGMKVRGKDLTNGDAFGAPENPGDQQGPDVSGERVVWEAQRTGEPGFGTYDLYGARLDLAPLPPTGLSAAGSAGGVALDWARNSEADLAGYNVYRAGSENGTYAKLNTRGPLISPSFRDPEAPKGARSFYRVTAVDAAGSESAAAHASAVAANETSVSLSASLNQTGFTGGTVTLSGRLTAGAEGLSGKTVALQQRPEGASWTSVAGGQLTTLPDGGFSMTLPGVDRDTDYRAHFEGTEDALPSTSDPAAVDVKTTISVSASKVVRYGRTATIYGLVLPNKTGEVRLTFKRGGATVHERTVQVTNNAFRTAYKPTGVGFHQVVASFGMGEDDAGTTSTAKFVVKRVVRR